MTCQRFCKHAAMALALMLVFGPRADVAARGASSSLGSVMVTVLDSDGLPIRDLKTSDFLVREDNVTREVTDARLATDPLFIVFLVDTTKPPMGVQAATQDLRTGVAGFVKTVTADAPDAKVALMEYGGAAVMTVDFTRTAEDLNKAIQRLLPGQRASGVLFEALVDAGKALAKRASPRRAIVALNFAWPESSSLEPRGVADSVLKSGATLWAVSIQGGNDPSNFQIGSQSVDNTMSANRETVLNNLTGMTGGTRLTGVSNAALPAMLEKVAHCVAIQYVVTFARPDGPAGKVVQATAKRGAKALTAPWVR